MTRESRFIALFVVAALAFTAVVSAAPSNELYVKVTERLDAKAESDGKYVWQYDLTGGEFAIEINNADSTYKSGTADTRLLDIWIPIQDDNDTINWSDCAVNTSETTDYNIISNLCAVQICEITGTLTTGSCVCGDGTTGTTTTPGETPALDFNANINGTDNYEFVIHINELNGSSKVVVDCGMNITFRESLDYPIVFSESYTPNKIVNNACTNVSIELNITNNMSGSCFDLKMNVTKLLSSDGTYWEALNGSNPGQAGVLSADDKNITWSDKTVTSGSTLGLTFNTESCPNMTVNTSKAELGRAYVEFGLTDDSCPNGSRENLTIGTVTALGPAAVNLTKEHLQNSDPANWTINATFYNTAYDLNYTLFRYRLWAENGTDPSSVDPNDPALTGSEHNCTGVVDNVANRSYWVSCDGVDFTSDDIPVAFGQPFFQLIEGGIAGWDDYYQFENSKNTSEPLQSDYFLIENIWVINNYLIKATKEVIPMTGVPGCYNISIDVANLGPTCTPYIYIYDIVPDEFYNMSGTGISVGGTTYTSPYDIMVSDSNTLATIAKPGNAQPLTSEGIVDLEFARYLAYAKPPTVAENWTRGLSANTFNDSQYTGKTEGLTGEYDGTGYRWELFPLAGAGGEPEDECSAGKYTNLNVSAVDDILITYALCADDENVTYYPGELFVVGVDPIHASGTASPPASVGLGAGESSNELLLILVLALVAIAAVVALKKRG